MPDPKKFDNKADFMGACMHQTLKVEKKDRDQAIAQCLSMWADRNKSARRVVASFLEAIDKESDIVTDWKRTPRLKHRQQRQEQIMTKPTKGEKEKKKPFGYPGEMVEDLPTGKKKPFYPQQVKNG